MGWEVNASLRVFVEVDMGRVGRCRAESERRRGKVESLASEY